MSLAVVICLVLAAVAGGLAVSYFLKRPRARPGDEAQLRGGRILLPCMGSEISRRVVDAAVRLAKAEGATIVPVLLVRVPRELPLDSPLVPDSSDDLELLEAIQIRAAASGVGVDLRVSRGRSYRDALRRLLDQEHFERTIVSPTRGQDLGRSLEHVQFLVERVPGEVMILRPDPEDQDLIVAGGPNRRERATEVSLGSSEVGSRYRAGRVASSRVA
jgi:nucleotide-binding universal stress UspA family protein